MDISSDFQSDLFLTNTLFGDNQNVEFPHSEEVAENQTNSSPIQIVSYQSEENHIQRIQELQELIQKKQYLLSINRDLQNQLSSQLSVIETHLTNSQKVAILPLSMPSDKLQQTGDETEEDIYKKKVSETHNLLLSFPIQGSSLYFSKRKKAYPRYTSLDGVPLTYTNSIIPTHIQHWNKKEDQLLSSMVLSQCHQLIDSGNVPSSFRSYMTLYNSTTDTHQQTLLLHTLLPSLLQQFSWESISHELHHSATDCFVHWMNACDPFINQSSWEIQEDSRLLELVRKHQKTDWINIAKELNTGRTPFQCFERFVSALEMQDYNIKWTEEDEMKLKEGIQRFGKKDWKLVATMVPNRSWMQCRSRYYQSLLQESKKGHWSDLENTRLLLLLFFYGAGDWFRISKLMFTRKPAQCRDHWVNVLNPDIVKTEWSRADDKKLLKLTANKNPIAWKTICKHFPGRTADSCKTRYHCLVANENCSCFFLSRLFFTRLYMEYRTVNLQPINIKI